MIFIPSSRTQRRWNRTVDLAAPRGFKFLLGVILAGALLTACQPRAHTPQDVATLLPGGQAALTHRLVTLDNRLQVLLVNDPSADRSAAALSVGVGSLSDPKTAPGMAHFLEHMLFLGTEKYPDPAEYGRFMTSHAGWSNAYTSDDTTNYFFEVATAAFPEALDRFSQFFISPRFNSDLAAREINAVDSEHAKNLENDTWRIQQVQREQFDPAHPINRFSTGNLATLRGVSNAELVAFYKTHYSSNLMRLAVVGNQSVEELEQLVRERFSSVADKRLEAPRYPTTLVQPQKAVRVTRVIPVADERDLTLFYPLPPVEALYAVKPLLLIGFVLGHEGKGSLLSLLKKQGLATSLSAGTGESTADYAGFRIDIGLTPEGLRRWEDVAVLVQGAIRGLRERGIPRYIFEENRDMAELEFTHQNPMGSASRARMLSALMQSFPPAELPRAAFLLQRYDPGEYQRLLGAMTPDTLLVTLVAKGLPTDRIEKNYGTRWGSEALTGAAYQRLVEAQVPADWTLPEPNRFHPGAITLLPPEGPLKLAETSLHHLKEDGMPEPLLNRISALKGQAFASAKALLDHVTPLLTPKEQLRWLPVVLKDSLPLPTRLMDSPLGRIWYQPDWRFRQPKADFSLKFYLKDAASSPKAVMLNHLYTAVMAEGLNEYGYPIRLAGLNFALTSNESGLGLALNGYSARMLDLLDFLVPRLRKVAVDEATFATVKERMKRELENQPLAPPHEQSQYYWDLLMMSGEFSNASLLAALAPLSLADVQAYAGELFRRTWMEGVVVGNLDPHRVRDALQRTLQTLGSQPLPASQQVRPAVSPLPVNADQIFSLRLPVTNSLAYVYQQAGTTNPRLRGALLIIGRKLGESFYNDMRTRQQLGYMVWAGMGQREKTLSLAFLIQSGQYPADTLLDRMDDFMGRFVRDFKAMPDAEFETYRRAVNSAKLERSKSLDSVADRLFWIAYEQDEAWDYISRDMAAVNDLTRKEVEEILERQLTGGEKRRLTIRLTGREHAQSPRRGQPVNLPATTQGKPAASLTGSG